LLAASLVDRLEWARLSQWREDQATNLWLGLTRGALELPVGLISSVGIPNPNGMPLLGIPLARLPGLLAVSWTLGAIQAALVLALCFSLSLGFLERVAIAIVLLSSVLLRATSVEFWNNWILASVNLAFAISVVRYLRRPTAAWLPVWTFLAMFAPSLYLAGLVNCLVFAGVGTSLLIVHRPSSSPATWRVAAAASLAIALASSWITWLPYLREVGAVGIAAATSVGFPGRILGGLASVVLSPLWWPIHWVNPSWFGILQSNREILSPFAVAALWATDGLLAFQFAIFLAAGATLAWRWCIARRAEGPRAWPPLGPGLEQLVWIGGIAALAHVVSPLLGGPAWARGERMEMAIQWFPLLAAAWFGLALALPSSWRAGRAARKATLGVAVLFAVASLTLGQAVRDSYLSYRGPVLVPADVSLADKMAVVDAIAADWTRMGTGSRIPVDYALGGGVWAWVPAYGRGMERWYPAPMTLGRAFDFELLRRHGLSNDQEGRARSPPGAGRYVVSYSSRTPPVVEGRHVLHLPIGRLRLTIVERN
jgi:hypothetical protein